MWSWALLSTWSLYYWVSAKLHNDKYMDHETKESYALSVFVVSFVAASMVVVSVYAMYRMFTDLQHIRQQQFHVDDVRQEVNVNQEGNNIDLF